MDVAVVDIEAAVSGIAPQLIGTYGSVVLRYHSPDARNLSAMAMIRSIGHSIAYHFDATGEIQDDYAGSREGIWWIPDQQATHYLLLTNQGSKDLAIDLSLYDSMGKEATSKIDVPARGTKRLNIRQLVWSAGLTGAYGGIKVQTLNHSGSLDSVYMQFDERKSFSALMKMFDQGSAATLEERDYAHTGIWTLRAPMLALTHPDPALAFPEGTLLHPELFVRNTLGKTVNANLRFNWRAENTTGTATGPSFRLGPYETRPIDVAELQRASVIPDEANWATVVLTTDGKPDEVVAVAASYDKNLRFGAQTPFSDQLAFHWAGSMWEYDAQHDSLITTGNGGNKPLRAALTIYYGQGQKRFELEQTLQPNEQMWIDIGRLVREHVADKNGNFLPDNVTSGSYEIRDLTNKGVGNLIEGKLVYDKTYGHVIYGCADCCGYRPPTLLYNPLGIPLSSSDGNGVEALDTCSGYIEDVDSPFWGGWTTANHSIATVNYYGTHSGVAVGSTKSTATGYLQQSSIRETCPNDKETPNGNSNTIQLRLQGNPYNSIFVGTDPNLATANTIFATVSPSGGQLAISSSMPGDTFTTISTGTWVMHTVVASTAPDDRIITVTYTVNGEGTVAQSLNVTARQFAYVTNNSPSNTCVLGYGTSREYVYTPYTHPDKTAVPQGLGLAGTAVTESMSPTPPPNLIMGDGALNASSQFADQVVYCGAQPLQNLGTYTQTISIEGYQVRKNSLTFSSSGAAYSSQGPTQ
jgi:hypothetical protein